MPDFSSTKPFTGHTTSASGSIEAVICLIAITHGIKPMSPGVSTPLKKDISPLPETVRDSGVRIVMNNSFGFGGNDSSLIFTEYDGNNE